ncbi:MAG: LURP-one-related/scramblase family protein [Armatimonadota bacterium]
MRYQLQEKLLSFGRTFAIRDEANREVFRVHGKGFLVGKRLTVRDMTGAPVAEITQRLSLKPTYEIVRNGKLFATVSFDVKHLFRNSLIIDLPGQDGLTARGDFTAHEFQLFRNGQAVARVSKQWITIKDTYSIEIAPGEDDVAILAIAMVIDQAFFGDLSLALDLLANGQ